ncbi:MAG: acetyl-CoA carboxylase biotin carboxylase subunit [Candidatus Brocadia sp. AMX2]|uniref:Biotin carboxylase n=1 Tax=Candidatus Brocadia sinica JPN1 TaxID=1197129 RepID=A0ABQ0JZF7_9BACT|nr:MULTISPECIES: acetyl-CoA carboxylase biotin carboxylase subunit [Brocadia]KXK27877.1 MAG: biotin carboxylase [Candidatus Brocadia sinica]MBC6933694.1 acetyl-CoA carboxylase biotin carboxylase subunit [Candidatus Brocadia sp.]MBL1170485.1 acetyl-CoA carboxylase biotin carboxylase subunit [Candidatus Brocadia sp. AMX1]NOG40050.1 acetyl-CoA carboxylase biotin carboxylase subunit [Planctomycetota bacterium]KAA0243095.1 MAG: acetyl-CoA carboxylase biotin carboxylase subunit [Candidatus Brocadia 
MFSRIMIANRGEIALRIIRACREMGIETVVICSKSDENAMYLKQADITVCVGPPEAEGSYLNIPSIISAAEITDIEAIHPGYGFLSEVGHFAEVCESSKIVFIGPRSETLKKLGNKTEARKIAIANKVPVVPGSESVIKSQQQALDVAHKIGYPVIIKASSGGGGRGMRVAHNDISLVNSLAVAQREAEAAFKDPSIYIEKYIEDTRHIEVQIFGDNYGNIVHLGERDCTLQRRHQKLVEESPSPNITERLREEICKAAIKIARAVHYTNAGTVEFLVDKQGNFYFIEVNTRLQVEHPVTEMVTGIDLVKQQIRIAYGERLNIKQKKVRPRGVSIECRINAEDPQNGFRPQPGKIRIYNPPGGRGVRVDSHVHAGYEIPPYYDSLISKLIVHQKTREEAIACMKRALSEYVIEGVKTTIPLDLELISHPQFASGAINTLFVENLLSKGQH